MQNRFRNRLPLTAVRKTGNIPLCSRAGPFIGVVYRRIAMRFTIHTTEPGLSRGNAVLLRFAVITFRRCHAPLSQLLPHLRELVRQQALRPAPAFTLPRLSQRMKRGRLPYLRTSTRKKSSPYTSGPVKMLPSRQGRAVHAKPDRGRLVPDTPAAPCGKEYSCACSHSAGFKVFCWSTQPSDFPAQLLQPYHRGTARTCLPTSS